MRQRQFWVEPAHLLEIAKVQACRETVQEELHSTLPATASPVEFLEIAKAVMSTQPDIFAVFVADDLIDISHFSNEHLAVWASGHDKATQLYDRQDPTTECLTSRKGI